MRYLLSICVFASAALFAFAGAGLADPNLPDVPPHRHFVETPTGQLNAVGPQICGNPQLQHAFNQFHFNVHHSAIPVEAGGPGQIDTLGPQHGAPGLHNDKGAEITARACSFTG